MKISELRSGRVSSVLSVDWGRRRRRRKSRKRRRKRRRRRRKSRRGGGGTAGEEGGGEGGGEGRRREKEGRGGVGESRSFYWSQQPHSQAHTIEHGNQDNR